MQDPHSWGQVPAPHSWHCSSPCCLLLPGGPSHGGPWQSQALSSLLGHLQRESLMPKRSHRSPYADHTSLSVEFPFWFAFLFPPSAPGGSERVTPRVASVVLGSF